MSATRTVDSIGDFSTNDGIKRRIGGREIAVAATLIAVALALLVPLLRLGRWMMAHEYYHHTPLLALAAVAYAVYLLRRHPVAYQGIASLRVLAWAMVAIGLTAGVYVLPSRWMAAPAALATIAATANFYGGRRLSAVLRGPMILLLACIPLPVRMDNQFVISMQQLATFLASLWLDMAGVLHLAAGVDIRTVNNDYVVEDACSGIHSMFAAIAVGVVYGVLRNYRLVRLLALVAQMVFWVVIANALRVFLVVYGQSRWGVDLSSGISHDALGMVTFGVGILLALSGDHLWRYLHPSSKLVSIEDAFTDGTGPGFLDRPVGVGVVVGVVGILAVVGISSIALFSNFSKMSAERLSIEELALSSAIDFDDVSQSFFPAEMAGWRAVNFAVNEKTEESVFGGLKSFVWQYNNGSRTVLLSLDGPYPHWHNLADCYSALGWEVEPSRQVIEGVGAPFVAADLTLRRPPFDRGEVLFGCVAEDGSCVPPPEHFGADGFDFFGLRSRFGEQEEHVGGGGVVQLQLLDQTPVELSEAQKEQNRRLFAAALAHAFGNTEKLAGQ